MDNKIDELISELISLEPEFAKHKDELRKLLAKVIAARPDPVIDQNFITNLKQKLMTNMENQPEPKWNLIKQTFMTKMVFAAAGVVVVVLAAVVGLKYLNVNQNSVTKFSSQVKITRAEENAFGQLDQVSATGGKGGGGNQSLDAAAGTAPTGTAPAAMGIGGGGGGIGTEVIPPYEPTNYKYVYKGDALSLPDTKLDVYRKVAPDFSKTADLDAFGLGIVNLGSFGNLKVQSLNLIQDQGYNVYVDLTQGMISLSGFYDVMPLADTKLCTINGCPQPPPIDPKDVPGNSDLISIANDFLSQHGISTSTYGAPEVLEDQYTIMNKSAPTPEYMTVVYPLKINNEMVYDESGAKTGLMVGISIRSKKVTSVSNLSTQEYQASSYDAETDPGNILKLAEQGGIYGMYTDPNAKKTVEIDLGTPKMQLVQMWDYQNNSAQQLLVPSLIFPVTQQPGDGSFYRSAVVIPLTKNILNRNQGVGGGGPVLNESVPASMAPGK